MPTVPGGGGGSMGSGTKWQPRVGQGGVGQPGGMIPPPRNGGTPGFPNPRPTPGPSGPIIDPRQLPRKGGGGGMVGGGGPNMQGPWPGLRGGSKFATRPAQGSMSQPRARPMRPGMGLT